MFALKTSSLLLISYGNKSHPMWERKEGIQATGSDYTSGKGDQTEGTTGPRQGFLSFFFFQPKGPKEVCAVSQCYVSRN
ncbi:hypothetical protein CapIbe_011302 [Capra ibex]